MSACLPIKIALALGVGGAGAAGSGESEVVFSHEWFHYHQNASKAFQEVRNQGKECVSTPESGPCLSSALPAPPLW